MEENRENKAVAVQILFYFFPSNTIVEGVGCQILKLKKCSKLSMCCGSYLKWDSITLYSLIPLIGHLIKAKFETNVLTVLITCIPIFEIDLSFGVF